MPVLRNAKHEAFAQALASGRTATEAMDAAGYSDPRNSSRLTKNDEIAKRVAEIKSRVAEKAEWSAADRLQGLKAIYDANADKDARVAVSAIAEANKMQGSYAPAKHQHGGMIKTQSVNIDAEKIRGMSDNELDALESAIGKLLGSVVDPEDGEAA